MKSISSLASADGVFHSESEQQILECRAMKALLPSSFVAMFLCHFAETSSGVTFETNSNSVQNSDVSSLPKF